MTGTEGIRGADGDCGMEVDLLDHVSWHQAAIVVLVVSAFMLKSYAMKVKRRWRRMD